MSDLYVITSRSVNGPHDYRKATPADLLDALDFPTDEDVEVAYQSLYESSDRFTPAPWKVERALQAVADARRTEEEG